MNLTYQVENMTNVCVYFQNGFGMVFGIGVEVIPNTEIYDSFHFDFNKQGAGSSRALVSVVSSCPDCFKGYGIGKSLN